MEEILLDRQLHIFAYSQPAAVRELLSQHRSGSSDRQKILLSLVVLGEWLRASFEPADQESWLMPACIERDVTSSRTKSSNGNAL